ncbi:DNA alkylation repair protein [Paenibacillus sp. YSY-4.3]
MAEPLKLMYNEEFLSGFAEKVKRVYSPFEGATFIADVLAEPWDELELKARIRKISSTLGRFLPGNYEEALKVLYKIDEECVGFPYLFFPDFVEVYGQAEDHWELSMQALERFTSKSSAEFAVRPFLLREPERMMQQMMIWSKHNNEHVRRLSSEGCRPRLPWGQALPMFKRDPGPLLPLLEQLKADPSLYVRKSVANNLNDITKDHPSVVIRLACEWLGEHPDTDWIVRHACRNLIRKADPDIMKLFGYTDTADVEATPLVSDAALSVDKAIVAIGENSELAYDIRFRKGDFLRVRMEYGIDFVKANGQTSRKLFRLVDRDLPGGTRLTGSRKHSWKDLTTRRHYPGEHRIVLLVNGREVASAAVEVVPQN